LGGGKERGRGTEGGGQTGGGTDRKGKREGDKQGGGKDRKGTEGGDRCSSAVGGRLCPWALAVCRHALGRSHRWGVVASVGGRRVGGRSP
jgi:hypothetical protein